MAADPETLRKEVVECFDADPVVDAATGGGASIELLRQRNLFAVATDIDGTKLHGRQPAVVADIRRLPFRPSSLGGVLFSFCLHHIESAEERLGCVHQAARLLQPGGVIAIADWREAPDFHKGWSMPDPEALAAAGKAAGLVVEDAAQSGRLFKLVLRKPLPAQQARDERRRHHRMGRGLRTDRQRNG
ncbi:MAG: class I SAM-dependent methyltransferase [Armatimonadetes bacterium]|nr:class I SAM-dependent methyltransferase [Armatimonadota bacterium]